MRPGSWEGGEEGISFLNVSYEFLPPLIGNGNDSKIPSSLLSVFRGLSRAD
jgi:hypothetical protein